MKKNIKILIAEHDPVDLDLLHRELNKAEINYSFKVANGESEYIAELKTFVPDVILSDYTFPLFHGLTAFRIKQHLAPDTPFIFVSGTIGEEKSIELIKTGATDYVLKESLFTLGFKIKRALKEAADCVEKKRLEKAFQNEKERLYEIILQAPSSIGILTGPDHVFQMVNPFYLKLIGKDKNIIGKTVREVLPEVIDQGFIEILDKVYQSGEPFISDEIMLRLDQNSNGVLCDNYLNIVYQPYRDDLNAIQGVLFFIIDVTEQVISRQKIEESENRFRAIIEKSTEIITLSTRDGRILYISPSVTKTFGYSLTDFTLLFAFSFIHPDDLHEFDRNRRYLLDSVNASFEIQLRLLHKNGSWIWCEAVITNMLHESGVNAIVSSFRDISEKKAAEQQLEFNANNLDALINNTHDLMWSVDKDLNLITFNQPFANTVGLLTGHEIKKGSQTVSFQVPEEQLQRYQGFYERAFAGEAFTEIVFTESPVEFWSEISFYPIRKGEAVTGTACHSRNITKIKKVERNLLQSEKRYRRILETAQEGIWLLDEHNVVVFVNDKMCEILGYEKDEIVGRSNTAFRDPEGQKAAVDQIARRKKGHKETYEAKFVTKSGDIIWVRISANPILNDAGIYSGALGMVTDITESKNASDDMSRLTDRLLLATKSAGMGIWEWDIVNNDFMWDKAMFELYDINDAGSGSVHERWRNALHPDDKLRVSEDIRLALAGNELYDTEFRVVWRDSSVHYIKAKGITEKNSNGEIVKLLGVNWDITAPKERERQLNLLESVITNTTDSVIITEAEPLDAPGPKIVYVNGAFTKMSGYTLEELIGQNPRILQGPKSDTSELHRFGQAVRKWHPCEITIINYKKNGDEFWINISVSPVMNELGSYTHWICIAKDVTERKLSEMRLKDLNEDLRRHTKQLAISNAELEQFAYVASHDLQEPLRMITSFLTQLDKKYRDIIDEKGKTYIDFAVDGAKRMRQIILDLLEFSRLGRTDDSLETINLNQLVSEIQILFRKQISEKKAEIIVDPLPDVIAHVSPVRQVFHNLISNALKYSGVDRPSQIYVKVADLKEFWQFSITDNGIGLEREYFEKIFIIFQRLHRKEEFSGTGMGLAITKKLVEGWGGRIWVESEPGTGTSFYFTLLKRQ